MEQFEPASEPKPVASTENPSPEASDPAAASGFRCYICGEPSTEICSRCTRDTCNNHICERCLLCSDCCTCDEGHR